MYRKRFVRPEDQIQMLSRKNRGMDESAGRLPLDSKEVLSYKMRGERDCAVCHLFHQGTPVKEKAQDMGG